MTYRRSTWGFLLGLALVPSAASPGLLFVPEQYTTIQAALDVAGAGDVVSVAPGVYVENIAVEADGVTLLSRELHAATIDGNGVDHTVTCNNVTCTIEGFTITNSHGFKAGVFTSQKSQVIRDNRIVGNLGDGIWLSSGSVAMVEGNSITDNGNFDRGIRLNTGATGFIFNNYIARNSDGIEAFNVPGLVIEHNTIADNTTQNIVLGGTAVIRHNIIANSLYGIYYIDGYDSDLQGYVADHLTIAYNDLWNHSEFDYYAYLGGAPLSNVGAFTPAPGTGEIAADPLLLEVELSPGSPCIDAGADPATFSGTPCRDIEGKPRLIDGDLDGFAHPDIGAFEFENPATGPSEVTRLRWVVDGELALVWDAVEGVFQYSVYRGGVSALGYDYWGSCLATTATESFADPDDPEPGAGFFYLVTASDAQLAEGPSGFATCALRSNADPCAFP